MAMNYPTWWLRRNSKIRLFNRNHLEFNLPSVLRTDNTKNPYTKHLCQGATSNRVFITIFSYCNKELAIQIKNVLHFDLKFEPILWYKLK